MNVDVTIELMGYRNCTICTC